MCEQISDKTLLSLKFMEKMNLPVAHMLRLNLLFWSSSKAVFAA